MQKIIAFLLAGGAAACAGQASVPHLQGRWSLVELGGQPTAATASGPAPWLMIKAESIEGYDGCNQFSGRLDAPGSIMATRRGCAPGAVKLPLNLADPLPQLKAGQVHGERLDVPSTEGMPGFTMRKTP